MREDWSKIKYFTKDEFTCKCAKKCGLNNINFELVLLLDEAREEAGIPFNITSGCRCPEHNKKVGGKETSAHLEGLAVDIAASNSKQKHILLRNLLPRFKRIGYNPRGKFIHVDIDSTKPAPVFYDY